MASVAAGAALSWGALAAQAAESSNSSASNRANVFFISILLSDDGRFSAFL
jgi:hypothetical protein